MLFKVTKQTISRMRLVQVARLSSSSQIAWQDQRVVQTTRHSTNHVKQRRHIQQTILIVQKAMVKYHRAKQQRFRNETTKKVQTKIRYLSIIAHSIWTKADQLWIITNPLLWIGAWTKISWWTTHLWTMWLLLEQDLLVKHLVWLSKILEM